MMKLVTHVNDVHRRDYDVNDTDLLDPTDSDALVHGEWMYLNTSAKLVRAGSSAAAKATSGAYQVFTPKGSTDSQALGKVAVIMSRDYEVDTDMFDSSQSYSIGAKVGLDLVTVDGASRMVFTPEAELTADTDYVYGEVTLDPDNNDDKLRVHVQSPHLLAG